MPAAPVPPAVPARPTAPAAPRGPGVGAPAQAGRNCPACGAPVAEDQRYCLECGERQIARSDFLLAGGAGATTAAAAGAGPPPSAAPGETGEERRRGAWLLLGLVGLLLLAMGVGVLIGKAGKAPTLPTKVIEVGGSGTGTETSTSGEGGFTGNWPSGKTGYTVEVKTLPAGTSTAAIAAAKSAATAKGASGVGALKAEEFSSLGGSEYVIYSGQYASAAQAAAALGSLKKNFGGAKVIRVSNNGSGSGGSGSGATPQESKAKSGEAITKPAPLKKIEETKKHSKSYKEESEKLPNVVETG